PFYWAISDSQDMTVAPGVYTKRGFGGSAEYRYVLSQEEKGAMSGAFVYESFKNGAVRGYGSVKHEWKISPSLSLTADLNGVSDDDVLRDYAYDLQRRSAQRDIGSEGARFDVHPLVSRPIPLAGYLTVTPFVGGRATAYSTTVTGSHVPVGGGPPIEDTNGEWRVRELLEYGSDAESRASRV